jgi:uncharacterized membrane protein
MVLFSLGYLLNTLKFYIPLQLNFLPPHFIEDVLPIKYSSILIGDILHLAAMSLPVMYFIRKSGRPILISSLLFVLVMTTSQFITYTYKATTFEAHISLLFAGKPPYTYFPFLPWFAYILAGMIIGESLIKKWLSFTWLLIPFGAYCMIAGELSKAVGESYSFYKPTALQTAQHLGFVLFWIGNWSLIQNKVSKTHLGTLLTFCSRNITLIYFIQWPLIFILIPAFGYQTLSAVSAFSLATMCMLLTLSLTYLFTQKTTW